MNILTRYYFYIIILFFLVSHLNITAQSLVLNEIMFASNEQNNEFIEIYNLDTSTIDMNGFKIKYHTSTADEIFSINDNYNVEPNQFALIFEADYDFENGIYKDIIPTNTPIFILDDNAFGRSGMANTSDRIIYLINENEDTLDIYTYSADNENGYSDERISHDDNKWINSKVGNGTPGSKNSVAPVSFDLEISKFQSSKNYAIVGESIELEIKILNVGIEPAESSLLKIYNNLDQITPVISEELGLLNPSDSIIKLFSISDIRNGNNDFIAKIEFNKDENLSNNISIINVLGIEINEEQGDIVINEIMFAPNSPEPEWIEIYNNSEKEIGLRNYKIADNLDTNHVIDNDIFISPKEYFVFSDDSSIFTIYPEIENTAICNLPTLNNSYDRIILLDSLNRVIDSLSYYSDWGGKDNNSLERIDVNLFSSDPSNWKTSNFPTPGKINSISQKELDLAIDSIFTIPDIPLIDSVVQIVVTIQNIGKMGNEFTLELSEDLDNRGTSYSIIEKSQTQFLVSGESFNFKFEYKVPVTETDKHFLIKVIAQDDDTSNNSSKFELVASFLFNSIIVNEIMYSPINLEPEWVEFYNNSKYNIDINDWSISDVLTNPVNKSVSEEVIISPYEYFVITKSNSIHDFHKNLTSQIIVIPFANLNNDEDGIVLRDQNNRTIDSLKYSNFWGGKYGKSLERVNFNFSSINEHNWESSLDFEGSSPGRINSVTPKNYDLALVSLTIDPNYPVKGDEIFIGVKVQNYGKQNAENYTINFYKEEIGNREIIESVSSLSIVAGDSTIIKSNLFITILDTLEIGVEIEFNEDEDNGNNSISRIVVPGFNKNVVLINEIMFKPNKGEVEWIEIVNNSDTTISIKNWLLSDSKNRSIITEEDLLLNSKQYLVISDVGSNLLHRSDIRVIEMDLLDLSDTKDEIIISDFRKAIIDSVKYDVGKYFKMGVSLERISLDVESSDISNWTFSFDEKGSSLGVENSIHSLPINDFGDIIFTEIMFNPSDENSEFIELFNKSDNDIEIGGWKIGASDEDITFIFQSFILRSKEYFVIANDSSIYNNYSWLDSNSSIILENKSLNLSNSGKDLFLKDFRNQIVDSVSYSDNWHNSALLETKNISLELINTNLSRTNNNNWSSSVSEFGATPGRENSIKIDNKITKSKLEVTPNPFSPDNDGFEDFSFINYNLTDPISQIRIRIYDSKGRLVRSLVNNKLAGQSGTIIFDGLDEKNKPLKIGIYIILFEAINNNNSTVEVLKDVVVVARKL